MAHTLIFLGPQGSGKGTQVENVIDALGRAQVVDVQTGRGFRAMKESNSYTATRVTEIIESGELVPDFLTTGIVANELQQRLEADHHLTFDGFPRNTEQAAFLDEVLAFYNRTNVTVVYLDVPEDMVRERMLERGRADDTQESINLRLKLYKEQTEPIITYYQNRPETEFVTIDGSQTIEEVFTDIKTALNI